MIIWMTWISSTWNRLKQDVDTLQKNFRILSPRVTSGREGCRFFFLFQIFKLGGCHGGIGFVSNSENFYTRYPSIYPFHILSDAKIGSEKSSTRCLGAAFFGPQLSIGPNKTASVHVHNPITVPFHPSQVYGVNKWLKQPDVVQVWPPAVHIV